MVNLPLPPILPRHPRLKETFEVLFQFRVAASEHLRGIVEFFVALTESLADSATNAGFQ